MKLNTILKVIATVSLLMISSSVAYYYLFTLPSIEREKLLLIKDNEKKEQNIKQEKIDKYELCKKIAENNYTNNWSIACQRQAEVNQRELSKCLQNDYIINSPYQGKEWCYNNYGDTTENTKCVLKNGKLLNEKKENDIKNCLHEYEVIQ